MMATTTAFNVSATFADGDSLLTRRSRSDGPASLAGTKAMQLHALLTQCYGEGFDSFNRSDNGIKENLLWLAADLANEVRVLCDLASEATGS